VKADEKVNISPTSFSVTPSVTAKFAVAEIDGQKNWQKTVTAANSAYIRGPREKAYAPLLSINPCWALHIFSSVDYRSFFFSLLSISVEKFAKGFGEFEARICKNHGNLMRLPVPVANFSVLFA